MGMIDDKIETILIVTVDKLYDKAKTPLGVEEEDIRILKAITEIRKIMQQEGFESKKETSLPHEVSVEELLRIANRKSDD